MPPKSILERLVNRFVPTGLLPRRRNTETILRGLYERYQGRSLEEEFERTGISAEEASAFFDEVDEKFGAHIFSNDAEIRNAALDGSALRIASFVADRIPPAALSSR
jgi:hypothetical protein